VAIGAERDLHKLVHSLVQGTEAGWNSRCSKGTKRDDQPTIENEF